MNNLFEYGVQSDHYKCAILAMAAAMVSHAG